MNLMSDISGGVSTQMLGDDIKALAADDSVKSIVLDIDSGGGSVYGVEELVSIINEAKESKHITAVANSLAASAAYWIGLACSEFVVTPSGEVGSIGVITAHHDQSMADEAMGVDVTYITAGKYKAEGNPHQSLDEDALAALQSAVDVYYETFVNSVAKGRGVDAKTTKTLD